MVAPVLTTSTRTDAEPLLYHHATSSSSKSAPVPTLTTTSLPHSALRPAHTATSSPPFRLPSWLLLVISFGFLALTLSLLLAPTPTNHPCPYADVLGLTPVPSAVDPSVSMPAGHPAVDGQSEDDCPHLTIQRIARERQAQREEQQRRRAMGDIAVHHMDADDDAPFIDE